MRGNNLTTENSYDKYFLLKWKIENYNTEIDGRNFYDQHINELIKENNKVRKVSTRQDDDYTTGCSLHFDYFGKKYRLTAADFSKQKASDADSRPIQQIIFTGTLKAAAIIYYNLEQTKETVLKFSKWTTKVL